MIYLLSFWFLFTSRLKKKNIWIFKEKAKEHSNSTSLFFQAYLKLWERNLYKKGSWIGYNSKFENIPIFPHGIYGIFISSLAKIGKNAVIFHQVTIGSNTIENSKNFGAPIIGNNCYIGAGAKIIGNVKIGNNCRIGAGCVVSIDIPDNTTVVMNKPILITRSTPNDNHYRSFNGKKWIIVKNENIY